MNISHRFYGQNVIWQRATVLALAGFLSLPMGGMVPAAHAASFDCDGKSLQPDEKAICDNRALNDADVKMVTTFDLLVGLFAMGNRGSLQDEQKVWLTKRQACGSDVSCLKAAYETRIQQLTKAYEGLPRPL
jgi:uncharacterized protein